ncbi:MAG TPA: sugar-binding protein [Armatimonadota bacterium]|jgi:hypothetical protein
MADLVHRMAWRVFCTVLTMSLAAFGMAAITMTGTTSRPNNSTFVPGEPITLTFTVLGLTPQDTGVRLLLNTVDVLAKPVDTQELPVTLDGTGRCNLTVAVPPRLLGFYKVFAKLSNGVEVDPQGSRRKGFITYCVVPDPSQRTLYPMKESFFGLQGGYSVNQAVLPYLGVRWMLNGINWSNEEKSRPGELAEKWTAAHGKGDVYPSPNTVITSASYGGKPWKVYTICCLNGMPEWACLPDSFMRGNAPLTPEGEKAWRDYCLTVGKMMSSDHPDDDEHIYQITWEPEYPWNYKGTTAQLVRIYEISFAALHEADRKAVVIGPTRGWWDDESARLFKLGLGKYMDGFSCHPYNQFPPEAFGLISKIRSTKDMMRQISGRALPIYGTEQGFSTGDDPDKELMQAQGVVRMHLIMLGEGARLNYGFYVCDYPGEPGYGYYYALADKSAWGSKEIAPKQVAPAFAALTFLLEGTTRATPIEWLGDTAWGYTYERPGRLLLGLWDFSTTPRPIVLPVGVAQVDVYDWMGNKQTVATPGGVLKTTLSECPIYISGVSPKLWGHDAKKPLQLSKTHMTVCPSTKVEVQGTVEATLGTPLRGAVVIEPDERLGVKSTTIPVNLAAGQATPFRYVFEIPGKISLGAYTLKVTLHDAQGPMAAAGLMLTIVPPVTIDRVSPTLATVGRHAVEVICTEPQGQPVTGAVQVSLQGVPDSKVLQDFRIPAKGSQKLQITFEDLDVSPVRKYPAVVTVKTAGGFSFTQTFPVNFTQAQRLAPTIDGDLAEWAGVPAYALSGREWVVRSPQYYSGPNDLSATVRYAWDEKALYVACEVKDDTFLQPYTGFLIWKGDGLQLAFDLDPQKVEETSGNLLLDAGSKHRTSEINVALTKDGPFAIRGGSFDTVKFPLDPLPATKFPLAIVQRDGKVSYEMAIPWTTLGAIAAPKSGDAIGVALTVNDLDEKKQLDPSAIGIFGGIADGKDWRKFGTMLLNGAK